MKFCEVLVFLESRDSLERRLVRGERKQLVKKEEPVQTAAQSTQKLL